MDLGSECARERLLRDAVLAGDAAAWRAWYDEHFPRLAAYIGWRCGGLADLRDDVLHETWLIAIRRLKSFDPSRGPFASWLAGIAANVVRNELRARKRRRHRPLDAARETARIEDRAAIEKARRVAATLAAIEPQYEAVLRAKYLDQLSVEAIAAQWGESAKAVESRLTRARQAFRKHYEAHHDA